jgi:nucleoid-associated protein YgaU
MDFYLLSVTGGSDLHLPVNPSKVTVGGEKRIETVEIVNIGEVDFPSGDRRTSIRFSSFFPQEYDGSYCRYTRVPDPGSALKRLISWRLEGKPVRLLITASPINVLVLISRVNYDIRGGEPGDIYFDLEMRQWREIKIRKSAGTVTQKSVSTQGARPDTKPVPKVYTVKSGDSLYKIAKTQLGSGSKWNEIYSTNRKTIGPNPNLIYPGTKLVMPA